MNASWKVTLKASLVASAIGTGAWFFGISSMIWPTHPILADIAITVAATFIFMRLLSSER